MTDRVRIFDDPVAFWTEAGDYLHRDPLTYGVLIDYTLGFVEGSRPIASLTPPFWWAAEYDDDGAVVGAGMRTAPFAPYPPWLGKLSAEGVADLADQLLARGESVEMVLGVHAASVGLARRIAELTGRTAEIAIQMRLFELVDLAATQAPGGLREATPDDLPLIDDWLRRFEREADEQAGRTEGHVDGNRAPEELLRRIDQHLMWLWEVDGRPVSFSGRSTDLLGWVRVGPVYTPPGDRGHGYAGALVSALCEQIRAEGANASLYADLANPVSTGLYERIGFRPVGDSAQSMVR